jgi:hypothetical protein
MRFYDSILLKKTIPKMRKRGSLFLVLLVSIVMNYLAEYIGNSIFYAVIIYFIVGNLYYEGKKNIKAITSLFIVVFSIATELLTGILFYFIFGQVLVHLRENLLHLFLGGIVSKILLLMLVEFVIRIKNREISYVSLGSWFLILSIPVISIYLSVISVYEPIIENRYSVTSILTCLAILYINLITFYLFDSIVKQVHENNQYKFKEKQMLMQQEQYQNIISGYDQVKKVRHDMINHLIVLDSYLSDSQYNQAVKYIGKLSEELDLSKKGVISNNIIVDALINNSMEKAKKQNITFDYNIFIPNQLMMDDMDLCIVLGNVLDNAIEACDRITEVHRIKRINIAMKYNSGNIYLNVTNSYNAETIKQLNGRFLSSKGYREGNLLGIGLGNIQNIVDMYGGIFQVELDEKNFNLRIMLSDKKI